MSWKVTVPSHSPARLFMDAKDFCASDGTGATDFCASVWATGFCASDCAKATVESDIRTIDIRSRDSIKRRDFMFHSPLRVHFFFAFGASVIRWRTQLRSNSFLMPRHSLL